ncbi:MAG TPA: vWA domain-containing protein, partial [Chitinophagaceae bacterium]|nr:vWA domain-containing protein [Chitinophagaceae bacterium]
TGGGGGTGPGGSGNNQPGVVTAGEWNDLDHWDFWKKIINDTTFSPAKGYWGFDPSKRFSFIIKDQGGTPVEDCYIALKNSSGALWETRSDNSGKAELWAGLFSESENPSEVIVSYNNQNFNFNSIHEISQGPNQITLPLSDNDRQQIDVMFVVDATGSMGDELEYLKVELNDVLNRAAQNVDTQLRSASVFYRDEGDAYVTRVSPFTFDIETTVNFVKAQSAEGGGDWPEAVHSALADALQQQTWSANAKARLLFLLLDAPPHETESIKAEIKQYAKLAAKKGIKIIPVTASGIDKTTEFLMRFLSVSTNGTYVFITNDSGIGNEHLQATVGEYEVEFLNDLMVRLIQKYSK